MGDGLKLVEQLYKLAERFRSLVSCTGSNVLEYYLMLRLEGSVLFEDAWDSELLHPGNLMRVWELHSIDDYSIVRVVETVEFWGEPSFRFRFFDHLIGYDLKDVKRFDGMKNGKPFAYYRLDSSWFIFQDGVGIDADCRDNPAEILKRFGFYLYERCARGCEMVAEIIEREMDTDNRADEDDTDDGVLLDGLYRADALFVWNGNRYEWLTETMMDVLELLCKCYPEPVKPSAIQHKIGTIPEGGFKKIFRVNRKDKKGLHEVVSIISGRAPKGWYLIK